MGKIKIPGGGITPYVYDNAAEPNRVGLWVFNNTTAGNVPDLIGSNDLTQNADTFRYTYGLGSTSLGGGPWTNFRGTGGSDGAANRYYNYATSGLSPGTGDMTVELWYGAPINVIPFQIFDQVGVALLNCGNINAPSVGNGSIQSITRNDEGSLTAPTARPNGTHVARDGNIHKLRMVRDASESNLKVYFDGLLTFNITHASVGGTWTMDSLLFQLPHAMIYACRISHNATNNCGGPLGG